MNRLFGVLLVIVSAAAFGTLAIFGRYAYAAGMNTLTLLFLRFSISALLITALLVFRRERLPRGKSLALLIGMGAIGYVGQSFCFLTAIRYASAGLVALVLATFGTALVANPQGGQWMGILLALGAAAIYAVYIVVGSVVMQQVSAVQSSTAIPKEPNYCYTVDMD